MNKTVVPLTDTERRVLSAFADGDTPVLIAGSGIAKIDEVNGILSRRASMSRKRAAELVAEPVPAEQSPLTAPIGKPNGAAARPANKTSTTAVSLVKPLRASEVPTRRVSEATTDPAPAPTATPTTIEPSPPTTSDPAEELTAAEQLLDDGIRDVAARLRTLVASLAMTLTCNHRVGVLRGYIADLEGQLAKARAELASHDPKEPA